MSDRRRFDPAAVTIGAAGIRSTAKDANAALSAVGNPVTDAGPYTFFWIFDEPLPADADYLCTVEADGRVYGVTSPASSRAEIPDCIKLYFQLGDGKQTDFVDGVKVEDPQTAKFDVGKFSGTVVSSLYVTDKQQDGVFPTGLKLIRRKSIPVSPAE